MKNIYKNVCKTLSLALMISTVSVAFHNDACASDESRADLPLHSGVGLPEKIGLGVAYQQSQPAISVLKNIKKMLDSGEEIDPRTALDYICFGQIKENAGSYIPQVRKSKKHQKPTGDFVSKTRAESDVKELVFDIIWRMTKDTSATDLQEMIKENLQGELPEYIKRHMSNGLSNIVRAAGELRADQNANIDWFIKLAKFDPTTHIKEKSASVSSIKSLFEEKSESGNVSTPKKPSESPKKPVTRGNVLSKVQVLESSATDDSSKMPGSTPKKAPLPKSPRKEASDVSSVPHHDSLPESPHKEVSGVPSVIEGHLPHSNVPTSPKKSVLDAYKENKKIAKKELRDRHREEELVSKEDRTARDFNALKEAITRYKKYTLNPNQHSDTLASFKTEVESTAKLLNGEGYVRINPSQKKELLEMVRSTPALSGYIEGISVENVRDHADTSSGADDSQDKDPFSAFMLPLFDVPTPKKGHSLKSDSGDQRKGETPSDEVVAHEVGSDKNTTNDSASETIVITPSSEQEINDGASKKNSNSNEDDKVESKAKPPYLLPRIDRPRGDKKRTKPSQEHLKKLRSQTKQDASAVEKKQEGSLVGDLNHSDEASNGTSFDALLSSFSTNDGAIDPSKKEGSPLENVTNDGGGTSDILVSPTDDVQDDALDTTHKPSGLPDLLSNVSLHNKDDEKKSAGDGSSSEDTNDGAVSDIFSSTPLEVSGDLPLGGDDSRKSNSNSTPSTFLNNATLVPVGEDPLSKTQRSSDDKDSSSEEEGANDLSGDGIPLQLMTHHDGSSDSKDKSSVKETGDPETHHSSTPVVQQPTVNTTSQPPMPGAKLTDTSGQRASGRANTSQNTNNTNAKKKKNSNETCCVQ